MNVVITGAGGFVGRALAVRLLDDANALGGSVTRLCLSDIKLDGFPSDPRVRLVAGELTNTTVLDALLADGVDVVFHLAAIPGGAAEANDALGRVVNLTAPIALVDALRRVSSPARLVFTSSIAVFGTPMPDHVDDMTLPQPTMSYGVQKLMMEAFLSDASRRHVVDARCVRLPGIVARPHQPSGHISAFLSDVFHVLAAGERFTCPVRPSATTWLMSRTCCVDNLIHAARLASLSIPAWRAWTLPALRVRLADLVRAIGSYLGTDVVHLVDYRPDEEVEAQFGRYPPLTTAIADALGFRNDGSPAALVASVLGAPGKKSATFATR